MSAQEADGEHAQSGLQGDLDRPPQPPQSQEQEQQQQQQHEQEQDHAEDSSQQSPPSEKPTSAPSTPSTTQTATPYTMKSSHEFATTKPETASPVPSDQDTAPTPQASTTADQHLVHPGRFHDIIPLLIFFAAVISFAVISGIAIASFAKVDGLGGGVGSSDSVDTGSSATLNFHTIYLLLFVCGLGLVIAGLYLMLLRVFTKEIIEVTLALTVVLNFGICIYYFVIKYWSGAVVFLLVSIFSVLFHLLLGKRVPLATMLLQITMKVSRRHPSVYLVVLLGLLAQTALSVWYVFTCIAVYVKWTPESEACVESECSSATVTGLVIYCSLVFYWMSQVVANVVMCTLAGGIYGGWYYLGFRTDCGPPSGPTGIPKRANLHAFIRSSTHSLGSIAFGSMIVTVLEVFRIILQMVHFLEASHGDMVGSILSSVGSCFMGFIETLVAYFNKYAYIEIALYGKPFIPASRDAWRMLKDRGVDAILSDSIVSSGTTTALLCGAYLNGFLCSVLGYLYLRFTHPPYNSDGQYSAVVIFFAFHIGFAEGMCMCSAIEAGVSTIFVGLGEHPKVLAERSPELFELIKKHYPKVVRDVQGETHEV